MKFISKAQEKAYKQAMKRKYKAVAFDVDGTLTKFARFRIPRSLKKTLESLPESFPLAICTGRKLSYLTGELDHLIHKKNRYVFCENGCIGYKYMPKKDDFKKIFETPWPTKRLTPDTLAAFLKNELGWHVTISVREHSVVEFYHSWLYVFPKLVRKVSKRSAVELKKILTEMKVNDILRTQDSGIGNIIMPKDGGKGHAMQAWAKHLKISPKDILVIGDQANPGENDEDFLNGKNGTSFTVGRQTKNVYPLPVLDAKHRKVWGPKGTNFLLQNLEI